ncbi:gamma-glutamylcyclotransferase [Shimia sp. R9_1]|uniref:gamma-glutamylcyclotransferase n=1 Tax=unclassified Shimia TaxID=2630038 RepID=UPI001ADBE9B6|nr:MULTISPECIES: gamma-glutamylcyclotransferase [unclassified Shimia]MBO9397790.1 gamma-glutamylcyclotransferase [Shimia sp. R9_2]MBO9402358.1 gamma-glutamylcyclotransferase [Shimia sp. R9_3]MBO9409020.1 gamma-glutamylcyclotransferase [Shimia sp. R9_1]
MWVFGYGSLLWNPGFEVAEQAVARLDGWHRSFCMRSIHHRGTVEHPGLVLALDAEVGAHCQGLALKVAEGHEARTLEYLRERELISSAYLERNLPLTLTDGRVVEAVTYVIDPEHVQYCHLPLAEQAAIISTAVGGRGPNTEYLHNTANHLFELGIEDADLAWLSREVSRMTTA